MEGLGTLVTEHDEIHGNCQLMPITEIAELCKLRDLYRKDWPRHCVGYYCLDNFIRWLRQRPDVQNLYIFSLNGDWRNDGLYLVVDRYQLFVNSLSIVDNMQLRCALALLDWSIGYKVSSVRQCHHNAVLSVLEAKSLELDYNNETLMYHMPCKQALELKVNCPAGYSLCPVKDNDAKCIDDLWGNKHKGSLFLIKRLISWNINVGIYAQENNELVAWCLRLQGGFLGALQVKDTHKRLGLGTVVATAIAQRIAQTGDDVMALVYESNHAARRMFERLGFTIVDRCYWLRPFPTMKDYEWPDNITLRALYQRDYNANVVGFHVLGNFIKWFECDPLLRHVAMYTFGEQWKESGRYLIVDRYALFLNSLIPSDEELGKALKLLNWTRGYKITALPESQYEVISTALQEINVQWRQVELHVRRLPKEKALQFDMSFPDEYDFRSLDKCAAAIINSYWYSRQAGSLFFFERLIKHNLSVGVYRRDTQELIAWSTRCQNGFLGSLFVKEDYRRRGLAETIIKKFSRQLAENSEDTFSAASVLNQISNGLLAKMGFEVVTNVYHLVAYRVPEGMEWALDDCLM